MTYPLAMKRPPWSIVLTGGPMDGWVVKPDAPVLRDGWAQTWPPFMVGGRTVRALHRAGIHSLCRNHPGRYVVDGDTATWQEDA